MLNVGLPSGHRDMDQFALYLHLEEGVNGVSCSCLLGDRGEKGR